MHLNTEHTEKEARHDPASAPSAQRSLVQQVRPCFPGQ
jgi:hypothetical protein